jgi:hypothetical protein
MFSFFFYSFFENRRNIGKLFELLCLLFFSWYYLILVYYVDCCFFFLFSFSRMFFFPLKYYFSGLTRVNQHSTISSHPSVNFRYFFLFFYPLLVRKSKKIMSSRHTDKTESIYSLFRNTLIKSSVFYFYVLFLFISYYCVDNQIEVNDIDFCKEVFSFILISFLFSLLFFFFSLVSVFSLLFL